MVVKPNIDPKTIQEIVTTRQTIIREVVRKAVKEVESIPAGYGMSLDSFKRQVVLRLEAITSTME